MYEEMEHVWPEMFHDTVEPAHGWSEEDQEEDVPFEIDIDAMDEIEGVTTPQALAHLNSLFHLAGKQGSPRWSNITIDPALLTIRDEIVPLNPFESSTPTERDITGKTENSRLEITVDPAEITIRDVTVPLARGVITQIGRHGELEPFSHAENSLNGQQDQGQGVHAISRSEDIPAGSLAGPGTRPRGRDRSYL
jgi:hypothetical protein